MAVGNGGFLRCDQNIAAAISYDIESEDAITIAAEWLVAHRHELPAAVIPILKERFGFRNLVAIEVLKRARALEWGGGHV